MSEYPSVPDAEVDGLVQVAAHPSMAHLSSTAQPYRPRRDRLRTRRDRSRGQALVEFVLVLPPLLLVLLGIIQFGLVFADWIQVTNATRDGARKAAVSRYNASGVSAVTTTAKNSTWSLNKSAMTVTVSPAQPWTAGQTVTVTVKYPFSINILGVVVKSGNLTSSETARIE